MLQVVNRTPLAATLSVFANPAGVECAYGAVKATFDLSSGTPTLAARQTQFLAADVYWGDPLATSLRAAADITLLKPATDIMVLGRAIAPRPLAVMDVVIRVGAVAKTLRVFGNRRWAKRGKSWAITEPQAFERLPLRWEHAFGGTGKLVEGKAPEHEARNPVGAGFVASYENDFDGRALPNIEDPAQLIATPKDHPAPAGCAPVAPVWMPRRSYAGTYDEAWQTSRAPYLPKDFDARFFNTAAAGLTAAGFLLGGENVEVQGCTAGAPLRFVLPAPRVSMQWSFDGRTVDAEPRLDTVLVEPDQARLQMVWRAELVVDKRLTRLKHLEVACPDYAVDRKAA
jgi:hypothetical protein